MRLSTSQIFALGTQAIDRQQTNLLQTQQQISSGLRVQTPSDDPVAAAQIWQVNESIAENTQYSANLGQAKSTLSLSDSVLAQVDNLLQSSRTLVVEANNGTVSAQDRASIATQLSQQLQQLIGLANTGDGNGGYLYSGFKQGSPPYAATASGAAYSGDQGQRLIQVSGSRQIAISDNGSAIFDRAKAGNGSFVVTPSATNTGTVAAGASSVTNPAQLTGDSYSIAFNVTGGATPVTTYSVVDTTTSTTLSSNNPYTDGGAISFAGVQFTLSGSPANGDQVTLTPSPQQSVFTTLTNLITTLQSSASSPAALAQLSSSLSTGLQSIDQAQNQVLNTRASIGARLNEVDALTTSNGNQSVQFQTNLSNLQSVDYNQAISNLAQQQIALQAAQQSFVKISGLSLFNYIN